MDIQDEHAAREPKEQDAGGLPAWARKDATFTFTFTALPFTASPQSFSVSPDSVSVPADSFSFTPDSVSVSPDSGTGPSGSLPKAS